MSNAVYLDSEEARGNMKTRTANRSPLHRSGISYREEQPEASAGCV